ncbi:MAG TPA: OmpA family protein [Candidatus Sulfotelmatobacter sp.]|nr:OmpA family protein [Candidatus Sulfotelmatobacter sp.]
MVRTMLAPVNESEIVPKDSLSGCDGERGNIMNITTIVRGRMFLLSAFAAFIFLFAGLAAAQDTKIQGLIVGRSGATMTVKTLDSENVVVVLTTDTQVDEIQGLFKLRKKELGLTALIPGLPVQVKGSMNDNHQLVADQVRFKGSDLKMAEDIQAGLTPTQAQVDANQSDIQADAKKISANQESIDANEQKIAVNQTDIIAANKRFGELGEYNILGETTVYFGNGQVGIDPKFKPELLSLAKKALTINGYIIQVQGYASAVGSAALNQKLSSERADNVLAFLEQDASIPLTNVLAPGAMGTTDQVASNQTTEGQAENRRVVVRILQNKGIAGS